MAESENPVVSQIVNAGIVREHFGYWPDFHDAEIVKVIFEAHPGYRASVMFVIAAFEITKGIDERGYYKLAKHCDIKLQFTGIQEIEFNDFGHQNVIFGLTLEESGSNIKCTFDSSVGMDAVIVAEEALVLSLTPTKQ
ncbi:Imm50 family immunity protein [Hymenobacter sp. GOD-10R]|uniref:Imm50 family immunity protein n=1 Tax=Hymenobacter sp. GOD-10R TaxID=3093922 RepID=UPI002D76854D|nr:Imm50 family immunity protein [Hymenobacter sp. GOD-10R]WRQ28915.1 Imm50 family immunity protein [Hymenobacter sp. GOD-10R]